MNDFVIDGGIQEVNPPTAQAARSGGAAGAGGAGADAGASSAGADAAGNAAAVAAAAQAAAGADGSIAILADAPVPRTVSQVRNLLSMRAELSSQLNNADARSKTLASELETAPSAAREGITERLQVIQERMVAMESQLATTGWQLAQTPASLLSQAAQTTSSTRSASLRSDEITALSGAFILFVLAPIAIAYALRVFKRGRRLPESPRDVENAQRLKRMEHAVDAVAIEVERISEGQRFLTNLFAREHNQRQAAVAAVAAGSAAAEAAQQNTPPHS